MWTKPFFNGRDASPITHHVFHVVVFIAKPDAEGPARVAGSAARSTRPSALPTSKHRMRAASVVDDGEARGAVFGHSAPELVREPGWQKKKARATFRAPRGRSCTNHSASRFGPRHLYPKSVRRSSHTRAPRGAHAHPPILVPPPASPVIASSIALIADRPPFPSLRSARPPHFPFDPHTKNTMAFTSTAARLPGSLVRAEAKPSRTGKSARRLTPRRAIAEPAKAASSKFTPAWKLQVRSRPNRPTSVPKRRASAPTSSADRKVSLLQPIAADASPLSPIFPSAIRPPPP
jgi:hypothetical protein